MTGLLLLAVTGLWIWVDAKLTQRVLCSVQSRPKRRLASAFVFLFLLVLPVSDEIVGGFQFRALCDANARLRIDVSRIKGATVETVINPSNEVLLGQILTTYHSHFSFVESTNKVELASYDTYFVKGGFLVRLLGISENTSPLTIAPANCSPPGRGLLDRTYEFTLIT